MPTVELLDPRQHGQLRLRAPADPPHFVPIVPSEFPAAAACCPLLFTKDAETGAFYAGAMFGFKPGENLVGSLDERGGFQPLSLRREGFFTSGSHIAIDRDHARFDSVEGEALFDGALQPAPALRGIQQALGEIQAGLERMKTLMGELTDLGLLEPIDVSLSFRTGERLSLQGLYTVSLDRLRDVGDEVALRLFRAGHLQLIYVMAASLRHIGRLARRREQAT